MKKIIIILSMLTLFGCGTDNTDPMYDCKSDRDCSDDYYCIERVCIYNPQCETDDDCIDSEFCNEEYQCVNLWEADTCLNQACAGDCTECGPYTACYMGDCLNACEVYLLLMKAHNTDKCQAFDNCEVCECLIQGGVLSWGECVEDTRCDVDNKNNLISYKGKVDDIETWYAESDEGIDRSCREF